MPRSSSSISCTGRPEAPSLLSAPGGELGAWYLGQGRCRFLVWAPRDRRVQVALEDDHGASGRVVELQPAGRGYHLAIAEGVRPGTRYRYRLNGAQLPDPASRRQPDGVHGPSEVVDPRSFAWTDQGWSGPPLSRFVLYELHVGTYTPEGTFRGLISRLEALAELGVTALELMPVAQFPGARNWGYDGVFPYAVQDSYGGADGLRLLVDACHALGLAVVLDVVYNHLGPEGNVLGRFGPYLTDRYQTPWGAALNMDGRGSDEVRRFFIGNALEWFEWYHVDALRLDAIQAIVDCSAVPFLRELAQATEALADRLGRRLLLIAESDLGDPRVTAPPEVGGLGLHAQWVDDFHHSVHAALTGERSGYYQDFGRIEDVATALRQGHVYTGQYSLARDRRQGAAPDRLDGREVVVNVQNHDQVGNRAAGERLCHLVEFRGAKLAAGLLLLSPFVPLLFMGEEFGEDAPFLFFVSHSDHRLIEATRRGRAEEFAGLAWAGEPPDPQEEATFLRSKVDHGLAESGWHRRLRDLYRELLALRRSSGALEPAPQPDLDVRVDGETILLHRRRDAEEALAVFNLGSETLISPGYGGARWANALESEDERWGGGGTSLPRRVDLSGEATLRMPRWAFVLLLRDRRGE